MIDGINYGKEKRKKRLSSKKIKKASENRKSWNSERLSLSNFKINSSEDGYIPDINMDAYDVENNDEV